MYSVEAESVVCNYKASKKSFQEFIDGLEFKLISKTEDMIEFDLLNAHPSLANGLRRVLIAEVPSVAIHNIAVRENDTVFPDEYIAHRLGLIPIDADPHLLYTDSNSGNSDTLEFKLTVRNDTNEIVSLFSDQIIWVPKEGQECMHVQIKPGVLICKMAPGNFIDMDLSAEAGIGRTHAKWSPVSLCSYRLMPKIVIEKDFFGDDALELQKCFSPGVIAIIDGKAVVENPRLESMSREVFRHDKFKDHVKILREDGWFCFKVETISMDPLEILKNAISVMIKKCRMLKLEVETLREQL